MADVGIYPQIYRYQKQRTVLGIKPTSRAGLYSQNSRLNIKSPSAELALWQGEASVAILLDAGRAVCRQIFRNCVGISRLLSRSSFQILFEFVCNHVELFNRVIYLIQILQLTHFLGNAPDSVRVGF
jgi:hypothetical protein